MTEKQLPFYKQFWFEETVSLLFKLHPIILFALGWMDAKESFLVLVLGYLLFALRIQAWMGFVFVFDYKYFVWRNPARSIASRLFSAVGYLLGFVIVLFIWLFVYLIFFGLYYEAVAKQYPFEGPGPFDGASGQLLIQTLWINGIYFFVLEVIHVVKRIKEYRIENHDMMKAIFLDVPMQRLNKWSALPIAWLMLFSFTFIFMLTGRAFALAMLLYFIFDVGFTFLKRLEKRKNGVYVANQFLVKTADGGDPAGRRNGEGM